MRTLAIVFVATYHFFFPELLPNGWIGVDLFFVLSGFLIFSFSPNAINQRFFATSFLQDRRAARCICLLSVPLLIFSFKPAFWLDVLFFPSLSAFVGAANIYFFFFQDYFNKLSYQPFLHFWTLGPEMHFIIIIAVLSFLTTRPVFFSVAFLVAIVSFFTNFFVSDSAAQFYLTPFRLYEFIAGGFARAIYQRQLSDRLSSFVMVFIQLLAIVGLLGLAAGIIGETRFEVSNLALILVSVFLAISGHIQFRDKLNAFFSTVALRSYSIYLLHYPFAFFSKTIGLKFLETLPMLASSLLVAEVFYRFVDLKVLRKTLGIGVLKWCLLVSVFGTSFVIAVTTFGDNEKFSGKADDNFSIQEEVRIVALGDSHLPHAKLFLDKLGLPVDYVPVNCLPVPNTTHTYAVTYFSRKNQKCVEQNSMWDEKYSAYDFVLLAASMEPSIYW